MTQYLVAIHLPDDFAPSRVDKAMERDIDVLNEVMEAKGVRLFAGGLLPASSAKSLRAQPDGKVLITDGPTILVGGVDIPSQLIELCLVDEYLFVVGPVVGGEGRRLLEGVSLPEKLQLKLVESKVFESGCVALHYVKQ